MRRSLMAVLCLCVGLRGLAPSYAAEKKATTSGQQQPEQGQQQMMKTCTDQATAKHLIWRCAQELHGHVHEEPLRMAAAGSVSFGQGFAGRVNGNTEAFSARSG